jgi:hypothetical protein
MVCAFLYLWSVVAGYRRHAMQHVDGTTRQGVVRNTGRNNARGGFAVGAPLPGVQPFARSRVAPFARNIMPRRRLATGAGEGCQWVRSVFVLQFGVPTGGACLPEGRLLDTQVALADLPGQVVHAMIVQASIPRWSFPTAARWPARSSRRRSRSPGSGQRPRHGG